MEKKINWKSEYKRCIQDIEYMIEHYVLCKPLYLAQKEILYNMKYNDTTVVSKSRDIGYTTLMAAYSACQMILNCDENYEILYVGCNGGTCVEFLRRVLSYINKIPKELWSADDTTVCTRQGTICVGKSQLRTANGKYGISDVFDKTNTFRPRYTVFDEPAYLEMDVKECIQQVLHYICDKYIIGSTPNPKNEKWFNFVKEYKETSSYVELPWWTNTNHKMGDDDDVEILSTPDGDPLYRTNRWYCDKRRHYLNDDEFDIEHSAKVWKYKVVKEYI